ncbi:MAG: hypothetical protein FJX23_10300, partial [Alphaproteobacteria bacterium]|nr:hypothetical protein [Alphaproteobacteria bacterium]
MKLVPKQHHDITQQMLDVLARDDLPSQPFHMVDLQTVDTLAGEWKQALSGLKCHYAIKCNPAVPVVKTVLSHGMGIDVASAGEIYQALDAAAELGIDSKDAAKRMVFSNPHKRDEDIETALKAGVKRMVYQDGEELNAIAGIAKRLGKRDVEVFCRIETDSGGIESDVPLGNKFGVDDEHALKLLTQAADAGLKPIGVSFHVGSQQTNYSAWDSPLGRTAEIFRKFAEARPDAAPLDFVDVGGGFPADLLEKSPDKAAFGNAIRRSLDKHFGNDWQEKLEVIAEPGRALVANSGVTRTSVLSLEDLPAKDGSGETRHRLTIDAGPFNAGLVEGVTYPAHVKRGKELVPLYTASNNAEGPEIYDNSCDSVGKVPAKGTSLNPRLTQGEDRIHRGDEILLS